MTDATQLTGEEIEAEWQKISPVIEELLRRVGDPHGFSVSAGSMLADDDEASSPRQLSHAFHTCLTAGVDHLHALMTLVRKSGTLHPMAPFSLARGALESLSTAYWLLYPATRAERMEHLLRWHAQNIKDSHTALEGRNIPNTDKAPKLAKLKTAAQQHIPGVDFQSVQRGYFSTHAVTCAKEHAPTSGDVLFAWRLCSGFAHGRPWAMLGASDREESPTGEPGVVGLRLTANDSAVLLVARTSTRLAVDLVELYCQRSGRRRSAPLLW